MQPTHTRPFVKICCISSHHEAQQAIAFGASAPGLANALLLDSGNPALAVKQLGGTGRTHDWQISRHIREQLALPLFLAGGLHADNVAQAVQTVAPFGLDLCSGVRSNGQLDPDKLARFMRTVGRVD